MLCQSGLQGLVMGLKSDGHRAAAVPTRRWRTHSPCCYLKNDCVPDPKGRDCSLAPGSDCVGWWGSMDSRHSPPPPLNKTVPIPTPVQLAWQDMEVGALITFNLASLGVLCGSPNATEQRCQQYGCYPKEVVARDFRGQHLNVTEWLEVAASFGGKYSVLNVDQWSGWLLWNSSSQNFTIANSVYGKDLFADYVAASKLLNLRAGTFFSNFENFFLGVAKGKVGGPDFRGLPVNRMYGQPALSQAQYNQMVSTQISELLLGYGAASDFDWWWDVPNSPSEGYNTAETAALNAQLDREMNGSSVCFNCWNRTTNNIRWAGTEYANPTIPMWHGQLFPKGNEGPVGGENYWGDPYGEVYAPTSCDTTFTGSTWPDGPESGKHYWMWHADDVPCQPTDGGNCKYDDNLRSLHALVQIYLATVGRSSNLLLNIAPNSTGGISDKQVQRYAEFGAAVLCLFSDADWESNTTVSLAQPVQWELPPGLAGRPNVSVTLQEHLTQGQLIETFQLEAYYSWMHPDQAWQPVLPSDVTATSNATKTANMSMCRGIGHKRIWMNVSLIGATKLRLTALSSFRSATGAAPRLRRIAITDMAKRVHCTQSSAPPPPTGSCSSDEMCSLNGVCQQNGTCACDAPWHGDSCGLLSFAPSPKAPAYEGLVWKDAGHSWGGSLW